MDDLATWLLEQIAEDERVAHDSGPARVAWATYRHEDGSMHYTSPVAEHGDVWVADGHETEPTSVDVVFDPTCALAECDAKRRIIAEHEHVEVISPWEKGIGCHICSRGYSGPEANGWCLTLRLLAVPYADRPGYQPEWAP